MQQLLELNVLNVAVLVAIHRPAMWVLGMPLEAKLHASALRVAMMCGDKEDGSGVNLGG